MLSRLLSDLRHAFGQRRFRHRACQPGPGSLGALLDAVLEDVLDRLAGSCAPGQHQRLVGSFHRCCDDSVRRTAPQALQRRRTRHDRRIFAHGLRHLAHLQRQRADRGACQRLHERATDRRCTQPYAPRYAERRRHQHIWQVLADLLTDVPHPAAQARHVLVARHQARNLLCLLHFALRVVEQRL